MLPTIDMSASPYDRAPATPKAPAPALIQIRPAARKRFVPSRFNARNIGDDGRLMLWNTSSGAISVFKAKDRDRVLAALSPQGVASPLDKVGDYLTRRGFLVASEANELDGFRYTFGQQHWRQDVLQFILLASEDCNFRCVYCYEKFKNGTMNPETRAGLRRALELRAPRLRHFGVSWFGGEPLYGWEAIEELAPYFKEVVERYGLTSSHHMTTNGYLLTEERATRLLEWGCDNYQITIDGLASEHDCKRVGRDGSPTHAVILDNLRSMKQRTAEFEIGIRVNFDNENFGRLGPFIEALSEDFGGDPRYVLHFHAIGRWGGDNDPNLDICGKGERRYVKDELRALAQEKNLRASGGIRGVSRPGSQVCYAARPFNFVVGATGKLMKCTVALDELEENVVGQLHPDGRMELSDAMMAKWVNPHFETDSLCQTCYVLPGCQGAACPLTRVTDGERTCCGIKSDLKREMRFTLEDRDRPPRGALPEFAMAGMD